MKESSALPYDPPLSSKGRARAYDLGAHLAESHVQFQIVLCSPYLQSIQTALQVSVYFRLFSVIFRVPRTWGGPRCRA